MRHATGLKYGNGSPADIQDPSPSHFNMASSDAKKEQTEHFWIGILYVTSS
uniref:Uncharacterized protein n=1 Tax=Peronospora matthiolae TaxID=2874970 RepID=A0AAV1T424_9STRA